MAPANEPLSELTNPFGPNVFQELPEYQAGEYADPLCPSA